MSDSKACGFKLSANISGTLYLIFDKLLAFGKYLIIFISFPFSLINFMSRKKKKEESSVFVGKKIDFSLCWEKNNLTVSFSVAE